MKLTKKQAKAKYPNVTFIGDYFYIEKGAEIGEEVHIGEGVRIGDRAIIEAWADIDEEAEIGKEAYIESGAVIRKEAYIGDKAVIEARAEIEDRAVIRAGAYIGDEAVIRKRAFIEEGAIIGAGAKGVTACLVICGLGNTKKLTAYLCDKGLEIVIGCFTGTLEEAQKEIDEKYPDEHSYNYALLLINQWAVEKLEKE